MNAKHLAALLLFALALAPLPGRAQAAATAGRGSAPPPSAAVFTPDGTMDRSKIPDQYKWKLAALFQDDAAFDAGLSEAESLRGQVLAFRGTLSDATKLADCLDRYFSTRRLTNRLTLYANLRLETAQTSTQCLSMNDRALKAMNDLIALAGFIRQEVLAQDDARLAKAYQAQPRLAAYRPYLTEVRRRRAHVLNAQAEQVLAQSGDNLWAEIDINELPSLFEKTFKALLSDIPLPVIQDENGKNVQLTLASFGKYRASTKRDVRRQAVESLFATLKKYQHTMAATLAGQYQFNVFLAQARGYRTALEAYLDKDDIPPAVYHNLISAIHANLAPLHRYIRLRKQIMHLDAIHVYDLYTPLVQGVRVEVPYAEARRMVCEALAPLGEDYLTMLRQGLDPANGWVDVYPHRDKDSGASCNFTPGIHPYVKLNFYNELDDVSTVAHEFGHALHSALSMTAQPYITANYSTFIAEIASTCNEKLLSDYLAAHAKNDAERLYILSEMVERIRTTIFRQALFAEFELAVHTAVENGTPITAEYLNKTYGDLIRTYYGPDFTMGPNDDIEWAYIPHFYYKYYVFTYATGLSSGIAIAERVQRQGAPARDAYLGMLRGGDSKPPLELLKGAGVDLTRPEAIEAAARLLDKTLGEMERILARRG